MNIRQDHVFLFALFQRSACNFRTVEAPSHSTESKLGDGTSVSSNADGKLVYAEYKNGMRVRRNEHSVLVSSNDGYYWYGDKAGQWFRLD
ncbi:MAG TPA: hypothetical protein V6C69_19360 [Trichormus sp.]|jgi:hypothetical protein